MRCSKRKRKKEFYMKRQVQISNNPRSPQCQTGSSITVFFPTPLIFSIYLSGQPQVAGPQVKYTYTKWLKMPLLFNTVIVWNQFGGSVIKNLFFVDFFGSVRLTYTRRGLWCVNILTQWLKRCTCSVRVPYSLKNWRIKTGRGNILFYQKRQVKISNRPPLSWSPDHYSTIAILLNPLPFHCALPLNNI
jgi:hypothetical protein